MKTLQCIMLIELYMATERATKRAAEKRIVCFAQAIRCRKRTIPDDDLKKTLLVRERPTLEKTYNAAVAMENNCESDSCLASKFDCLSATFVSRDSIQ